MANVEIRFWLSPEANRALTDAAELRSVTRSRYLQNVARHILVEHRPELEADELIPKGDAGPSKRFSRKRDHALGTGWWGRMSRAQFSAHPSLPFILSKIAQKTGDISMSELIRRYLADAIERDTGTRPPMPGGLKGTAFERKSIL